MIPTRHEQTLVALEAYREIQEELRQAGAFDGGPFATLPEAPFVPGQPGLAQILHDLGPLPRQTLFFGMAGDGLPVLFDLSDPEEGCGRGPVLVTAEANCGTTALLGSLALSIDLASGTDDVQFGVVTGQLEAWERVEAAPSSLGVWPASHPSAGGFLSQLASWAEHLRPGRSRIVLLVDGLDLLAEAGPQVQHDLRYLLMYGPERGIWPVASVEAGRAPGLSTWLNYFPVRIFGRIRQPRLARALSGDPDVCLERLVPGVDFLLQRRSGWLPFQVPPSE
ncbi:MAG: hypothetical protein JXB85_14625 [Anaerolineales bacterium]|nr:hypothetical protein [Anaerolineales bacterium]